MWNVRTNFIELAAMRNAKGGSLNEMPRKVVSSFLNKQGEQLS